MKKLKVVHLYNYDRGISLFIMPQLKALQRAGYEVHAIFPFGKEIGLIKKEGIVAHHLSVGRDIAFIKDLLMFFRLYRLLRRHNFYMLHAHTAKLEFFGQLAAYLARVPYIVYTNHGIIFRSAQIGNMKRWALRAMAKFSGKITDLVFSQSEEDMEFLIANKIYPKKKLHYLGNGIAISAFNPDQFNEEFRSAKKVSLGIPEIKIVVGMVGRFVYEKGYEELMYAAAALLKKRNDVFFLCIGNHTGNERDPFDFENLTDEKLKKHLLVLTSRNDMPELYSIMDIMVLPSHREGFPRALMEGAASGKALIASDIPGCREVVQDGHNGYLFKRGDTPGLEMKILNLIENEGLRLEMGKAGRVRALKEFDEHMMVQRFMAGLNRLMEKDV